ncbi:hypothetical protein BV898_03928 [Hypsibius exemplaris]|uniref:VWFC domain-containing protein n=1 Tax=Hypsibius exemplaris TaxID=2072580 RepID=A0A1W0X3L3_HYPEX|nr:hypothetical protein BV898_03928 [Hypsibius exemplaris]
MRELIFLAGATTFYTQLLLIQLVRSQSNTDPPPSSVTSCIDKAGQLFAPGAVVPSPGHPCRECVCGARGNILCESLSRVTDCPVPDDAPCRTINGSTCCERSFNCDRLVSCSHGGVQYQAGEMVEHDNQRCQQCRCGAEGRVKCQPVASCGLPSWIGELGGQDCVPVYTAGSCCPTDYSCRCVVFNETIGRGPRSVARCTTCSCSRSGGVEACEAVTCKIPYKFSDKCRPIYRADDCCPIDYDCSGMGGGKDKAADRANGAAVSGGGGFTVKPAVKHHKWDSNMEARMVGQDGLGAISRDDVMAYGQNDFQTGGKLGPLGRSEETPLEVVTKKTLQPQLQTAGPPVVGGMVVPSKRLRGGLPLKESGNLEQVDAAWRAINVSQPATGTEAILITAQDGLVLDPRAVVVQSVPNSTDGLPVKSPAVPAASSTAHDALLKVFMRVAAEKAKFTTTAPLSTASLATLISDDQTQSQPAGDSNKSLDTLEYDVPLLTTVTTPAPPKASRVRSRLDARSKAPPRSSSSSIPSPWSSLALNENATTVATSKPPIRRSGLGGTRGITSGTTTEASDSVSEIFSANNTASNSKATVTTTPNSLSPGKQSTLSLDVILFSTPPPAKSNSPTMSQAPMTTTPPSQSSTNFHGRFIGSSSSNNNNRNTSRFSLDSPFSMSSADAGFLADDLSYKLFSVNFFRSPLGSFTTTTTPAPSASASSRQPALNFGSGNASHYDAGGQGQRLYDFHSSDSVSGGGGGDNLTAADAPKTATNRSAVNTTELDMAESAGGMVNVTVPPDFQVVTFGALPRGGRKTAGKILFPPMPGMNGGGGGAPPILPFETEVEFKGFGMLPEIEIKPLKGLAGLAGMAMMANAAGGGGGSGNLGGQLAAGAIAPQPMSGNGLAGGNASPGPASRMAAAAAAQDAMEELAEGGTGDGALALAAAMMHNPHRPVPAKLMASTKIGRITTPPPTVAIVYPNGTLQIAGATQQVGNGRSGKISMLIEAPLGNLNGGFASPRSRLAEFNAFFNGGGGGGGMGGNQFGGGMAGNPWAPVFTGASATTAPGVTPDPATVTKDPFPFEAVADVIEEGRGPALTQLMGALQMMGRGGMGGGMGSVGGMGPPVPMANPFGLMPQARGSMAGMNAMMNGGMSRNNFFSQYAPQMMGGMGGGMGGFGGGLDAMGLGGMGGMMGNRGLFNLFAGSLSALESNANPPEMGSIAPTVVARTSKQKRHHQQQTQQTQRRLNPSMNSPSSSSAAAATAMGENTAVAMLRPMYKVGHGLTESPLVGLLRQQPMLAAME